MKMIANGKEYTVKDNGYIYLDDKRVSKAHLMADLEEDIRPTGRDTQENEVLERAEQSTITNKGNTMTYTEKIEAFGIDREALERKVGKTAYKPGNIDPQTGKQYMGSYLVNLNGVAKVIGETTYQGNLQISDVNMKSVGFYMPDLYNISDVKVLSEFESVRPGSISLDDLGTVEQPEQIIDIIQVLRVKFADLDLVTFLNETTGNYMGTKRYSIYKAEQELRLKKPDMDTMFNNLVDKDIAEMNGAYEERPDLSEKHLVPEYA